MVISVDNGFLSLYIVLPLLNASNHGVDFLIVHRVVQNSTMKHFRMIRYHLTSLVTREKLSMAKGKPQQTGMTAEINSIPTYAI
jgi:hypothetical protein